MSRFQVSGFRFRKPAVLSCEVFSTPFHRAGGCKCLALLLLFLCSAGCGYNLQATGKPKGITIPSLAIPLMKSPSSSLGFEGDFTRMIRQAFVSHSQIPLTTKEKAAMVLVGTVTDIRTEPLSYRISDENFEVTTSRWLKIRLSCKLVERATGKIIWDDPNMEQKAAFTVTSDPLQTSYNRQKAAEKIARLLSEIIYLRTMERF